MLFTAMSDVTAERRLEDDRREALAREQERAQHLALEVADRIRGEARIKELLDRLVTVQEEERKRLSRDLHDQLGQQLTALRLTLNVLKHLAPAPAAQSQIEVADAIAARLDRDVDHLAWELRPAALDELGLLAALDAFLRQWSDYHGISAELETSVGELRFTMDVENQLYRIVQEALNNVTKHAHATTVCVRIECSSHLLLTVHDNGQGFDPAAHGVSGIGLLGMGERVALIGGSLEVTSSARHGTTIAVRVPVPT